MLISVEVPDAIAHHLRLDGPQPGRRARELFALEGYRSGELSHGQVRDLLSLGLHETEQFLHEHGALLHYSVADLEQDASNLGEFFSR